MTGPTACFTKGRPQHLFSPVCQKGTDGKVNAKVVRFTLAKSFSGKLDSSETEELNLHFVKMKLCLHPTLFAIVWFRGEGGGCPSKMSVVNFLGLLRKEIVQLIHVLCNHLFVQKTAKEKICFI